MSAIAAVDCFVVTLPRDVPYLGPLKDGESVNSRGYIVRRGNRTIYPTVDRSVVVRIIAADGTIGWGETYGIVAPAAVVAIIDDVLAPVIIGRNARDTVVLRDELYDLMRVRGHGGGYYGDALAAIDIAIHDVAARLAGLPLCRLLGGQRTDRIPAYVSGLPRKTLDERVALARTFVDRGFDAVKFAAVVSQEGIVAEMRALRDALGPDIRLMVDLHWQFSAAEAMQLVDALAAFDPHFAEAPCAPEDIDGLGRVCVSSRVPIAAGEEWRTVHDALPRLQRGLSIVQPEMGHTGIAQFVAIGRLASAFHARVIPHATIGTGIFLAASLHASAALPDVRYHEYQHSVFDANLGLMKTSMRCDAGFYRVPDGPGLGVEPSDAFWKYATPAP